MFTVTNTTNARVLEGDKLNHADEPRINSDKVEFQRVKARRQHEGLFYFGPLTLDIITAAKLAQIATRGNFAAVPALKILRVKLVGK